MNNIIRLYSNNYTELNKFLNHFFNVSTFYDNSYTWENYYSNPIEMADIIAAFVDNSAKFPQIKMWISIDPGVFINIKDDNYNLFIKYLFERYPY